MIRILYFASVREQLNCSEEELESGSNTQTIAQLMSFLAKRDGNWQTIFSDKKQLLCAVNQTIAKHTQKIEDGDEVGFFPQVTGG